MTIIKQDDLIESVAAALQYISYYHPADYIAHLARAYEAEQSPAAKDAIAQILTNSRMCAEGKRPICQDTGIVNVFLKIGMGCRLEGFSGSITDAVNEGVRRAYNFDDNKLRASIVADPQFDRKNTKDNTPAVVHMELVPGNTIDVQVAAKGGGSENKTKFVMLNPSTANAKRDDPTIRRCMGFARAWGFGGVDVVNLFAFRATDPRALREAADPIGPANDRHLRRAVRSAGLIVLAWGAHEMARDRAARARPLFNRPGSRCLGLTQSGEPRHPLYLRRDASPVPVRFGRRSAA